MGLCSSKGSSKISPDAPWDPSAAARGTWLDVTGATPYDFIFVKLLKAEGAEGAAVTTSIKGGGCGKASEFGWKSVNSKNDKGRTWDVVAMLACQRAARCTTVEFRVGAATLAAPLPALDDAWVAHTVKEDGVTLTFELRGQPWETKLVTTDQLAACGLRTKTFELTGAGPGEKAVLTYARKEGNRRMIYWLPGRNDAFAHAHVLPRLLDAGWDVYAIEHRRLGRAIGATARDFELVSHVTDFKLYLQEHDAGLEWALAQGEYDDVCLYAHSTGGLEASVFLRESPLRGKITRCVLNSPFLDWGNGGVQEVLLDSLDELWPVLEAVKGKNAATTAVSKTTEPSGYGIRIWMQYPGAAPLTLRNPLTSHVTAGWVAAASHMHDELKKQKPNDVPTLLLHTDGDVVLDGDELQTLAKYFSSKAETREFKHCRHDMLLNYFAAQNDEVLDCIIGWLGS